MKTARFFVLAFAALAAQLASAQSYNSRTYTDVLGNRIIEYTDNYGRLTRKERVEVDVLGDTVVTVTDAYGRQIEQITYHTDILGATIITIRDGYGVIIEQIKFSTNIFGNAVTTITDRYGHTVRYKESHYRNYERFYAGYIDIHRNRPRHEVQRSPQRPPQYMGSKPNHKPQGEQRPSQFGDNKPQNRPPQQGQQPPQFGGNRPGGKPQTAPNGDKNNHNRPQPKGQNQKKFQQEVTAISGDFFFANSKIGGVLYYYIYRYSQKIEKRSTFFRKNAQTLSFFTKLFYLCTRFCNQTHQKSVLQGVQSQVL